MNDLQTEQIPSRKLRVAIHHTTDGYLMSRDVNNVPEKGDWISIGSETYVVIQRIWDYAGGNDIKIMVEEPKD